MDFFFKELSDAIWCLMAMLDWVVALLDNLQVFNFFKLVFFDDNLDSSV